MIRVNRKTLAMTAALAATAAVAGSIPVQSAQSADAQKVFRTALLIDGKVSDEVKQLLQSGGFIQPKMEFADFTGEGKADAVISVSSGGTAGNVAAYVLSAGSGSKLQVVYATERNYQIVAAARDNRLVLMRPKFAPGDAPCCPAKLETRELAWNAKKKAFRTASRVTR